ncbi:glycosyltransferase [Rubellimicrobium rubrum]|uniref:Glycosyltransferase n=1 Tax=Rubellimicrobium rubrum TaxID=2585369 RepID=A0A5C4MW30_9RHOB|nr:glycosyltransferase [Rubellimicrobium rubrum]TNC49188.1 glycosyltransferase [Rubellimicrobium rubrum]
MSLVLVRTPTYRRPELLKRAMRCLQAQTHQEWVCEVRDDCPDQSARAAVEELGDPRIHYIANRPQKFLVKNLDDCFLRENPYGAEYFYLFEDDNQVRPDFMTRGIEILKGTGLSICQINQEIEYKTGTAEAHAENYGIFDGIFDERIYQPKELRLGLFGGVGISNGAVFWSRNIRVELAFRMDTIPALDEPMRTYMVNEPVYIYRDKLAVWAKNEESTTRNLGVDKRWLRRELDLKKSLNALRRAVWERTPTKMRDEFLDGGILRVSKEDRFEPLRKAGIRVPGAYSDLGVKGQLKRLIVSQLGREHPSIATCIQRSSD